MTGNHVHDPQTLYRHWEDAQWSPFAIDLDADRRRTRPGAQEIREFALGGLTRRLKIIGAELS